MDFYCAMLLIQRFQFREETSVSKGTTRLKRSSKIVLRISLARHRHSRQFQCKEQRIAQLLLSQQICKRCTRRASLSADAKNSNRSNAVTYYGKCLQSAARNCQSFLSFKKARMTGSIWKECCTPKKLHSRGKPRNSACLD